MNSLYRWNKKSPQFLHVAFVPHGVFHQSLIRSLSWVRRCHTRFLFVQLASESRKVVELFTVWRWESSLPNNFIVSSFEDGIFRRSTRRRHLCKFHLVVPCAVQSPLHLFLRVHYDTFDSSLRVACEVRVGKILEMAFKATRRVFTDNFHVAVVINPQLANDNIVNSCCHFSPRKLVSALGEFNMGIAQRNNL